MTTVSASPPAVVHGVDVAAVAAAVAACPAVAGLVTGRPGGPATYLPGQQVGGVRIRPHRLEVAVRARWGVPAAEVAAQVRQALRTLAADRRVDVVIADLTDPPPAVAGPAEREAVECEH
ncbi:hypothetical protein ACQP1P_21565 [Dactylosporangium sp. CA-052675]|uniref:hypothetical protein n=1 Tax=Dactylosporangium sp. CA-052675 TaxID=3239927 RepID=UPI003D8F8483